MMIDILRQRILKKESNNLKNTIGNVDENKKVDFYSVRVSEVNDEKNASDKNSIVTSKALGSSRVNAV